MTWLDTRMIWYDLFGLFVECLNQRKWHWTRNNYSLNIVHELGFTLLHFFIIGLLELGVFLCNSVYFGLHHDRQCNIMFFSNITALSPSGPTQTPTSGMKLYVPHCKYLYCFCVVSLWTIRCRIACAYVCLIIQCEWC